MGVLMNLVLLVVVFGAAKRRMNPYFAPALFGGIKATLYYVGSQSVAIAIMAFCAFAGLVGLLVFLLRLMDQDEPEPDALRMYEGNPEPETKWEYVPVIVLVFIIVAGEFIAAAMLR